MVKGVKDFDKLSIQEQVNFINEELANDKSISVTKLCKKYGLNKSTIISRFNTEGYKYDINKREYAKNNNTDIEVIQDNNKTDTNIISKNIEKPTNDTDIDTDIKELIKYKNDILNMVKEYNNSNKVSDIKNTELIIDTDIISDKVSNHNFKVYESVKKEMQTLQTQYPQFRLLDLVSTALHEYYLKNKKK